MVITRFGWSNDDLPKLGGATPLETCLAEARSVPYSGDKTARLWDAATGKAVATLAGHTASITAVAFSPDGTRVLTGS